MQKLMTGAQRSQLIQNFMLNDGQEQTQDLKPVIKIFGGPATWLLSELNPDNGLMFGLCDLGQGFPELGYVTLQKLEDLRVPPLGLPLERDRFFKPLHTLSEYADKAKDAGRITV